MSVAQDGAVTFVDDDWIIKICRASCSCKVSKSRWSGKSWWKLLPDNQQTRAFQIGICLTQDGIGNLESGFLEMSNVDLAEEFTEMIVAQRGFQANTRIITTSDEILQELVNLKR